MPGNPLKLLIAEVAELVDARDLKSLVGNHVPVQVRPSVPIKSMSSSNLWEINRKRIQSVNFYIT